MWHKNFPQNITFGKVASIWKLLKSDHSQANQLYGNPKKVLKFTYRPEFWIDPLHGVPIQIVQIPWGSVWVCKRGRMCLRHGFAIPIHDSNLHSCNILLIQHCFNEISHNKENDENWWHDSNFTSQIACLRTYPDETIRRSYSFGKISSEYVSPLLQTYCWHEKTPKWTPAKKQDI